MEQNFTQIKAVIFDLDGTLINTLEDIQAANNRMLTQYGYPNYGVDQYKEWIGNGMLTLVTRSVFEGKQPSEATLKEMTACTTQNYFENYANKTHAYKGITEVLKTLKSKNIPMAILTNKPHRITLKVVNALFPTIPFQIVLGQSDRFPKKPAPDAALFIANELGVPPENFLFVGDSQVDMDTAQAAGMQALGVTWGYGTPVVEEHTLPSMIVEDVYMLNRLILENSSH